jgi:hypothetical protein
MKFENFFLLTWKKVLWIIIAWIAAVLLHNFVYGLFKGFFDRTGGDEPFFFLIAVVVIPLYLFISIVYTIVLRIKK